MCDLDEQVNSEAGVFRSHTPPFILLLTVTYTTCVYNGAVVILYSSSLRHRMSLLVIAIYEISRSRWFQYVQENPA